MEDSWIPERRLNRLERQNRWLMAGCVVSLAMALPTLASLYVPPAFAKAPAAAGVLRVRQLAIVDQNGVERVRIGAPLPDPVNQGKRHKRDGVVSGILLYDAQGNERSGYVTADGYANVLFTLDDVRRQHVLFLTEPDGATTLRLFNDAKDRAEMQVTSDGPSLTLQRHGAPVFEQPAKSAPAIPRAPGS